MLISRIRAGRPKRQNSSRGPICSTTKTTYAHAEHKIARERGHSTTVEAARIALKAGAGRLVIGHYSSRYKEESVLVEEARTVFPDTHPATEGTTFTIEKRQQP